MWHRDLGQHCSCSFAGSSAAHVCNIRGTAGFEMKDVVFSRVVHEGIG